MHYYVYDRPANEISHENPARFTWVPKEEMHEYEIEVYDLSGTLKYKYNGIDINFFTPSQTMSPGRYTYRVLADGVEIVSRKPFEIAQNAVATPLRIRKNRYNGVSAHPRLWIGQEKVERLKLRADSDLQPEWDAFMRQGVMPWLEREPVKEPERYPGDKRVISLWRQMYLDCQEALYTVKHCAIAWCVTGDDCILSASKKQLLSLAEWNVEGSTARTYNDEASFRVTTALAWGYDWLYDALTQAERERIRHALLYRARELYHYVKNQIQIHIKLLDSHGVRSLSMTLVPAALALLGEEPEASDWLNYIIEYFFTIFTPWGGMNGGWAEGPTYWKTGVSFFTEANCLLREALGIDVFKRPFFRNTGDFVLHTYSPDLKHMAFGDMSDLGDYPGMKAGYTMNILSAVSDSDNRQLYAWYYDQSKHRGQGTEGLFYNYGWWNFAFDELFFRMLFDKPTSKVPDGKLMIKHFSDVGWACIHKDIADEKKHVAFMFKSSPYGSVSHSHGDQNAFVLHAFGEPLAIQSGYYIGFWSEMHVNWRRQTKSKNAILIDGIGQFANLIKTTKAEEMNGSAKSQYDKLIAAKGRIEACENREDCVYMRGDATEAYLQTVPYLLENKRHVLYIDEKFFLIIDEISLSQEGSVQWLLHGLHEFQLSSNAFESLHNNVGFKVMFAGCDMQITQSNIFDGVDAKEAEGLDPQWHIQASTASTSKFHRIAAVLYPYQKGREEKLHVWADEDIHISFGKKSMRITKKEGSFHVTQADAAQHVK